MEVCCVQWRLDSGLVYLNANTPMNTTRIITNPNDLVPNALKNMSTGVHIVQCENAPAGFPVTSAYGLIFSFGSLLNYHQFLYMDKTNIYWNAYTYMQDAWVGWQATKTQYMDVSVTVPTAGTPMQISSASGYVITWDKFINGYVIDSNNIRVLFHTYNNLIYGTFLTNTGANAPAGTYKVRCWYNPYGNLAQST